MIWDLFKRKTNSHPSITALDRALDDLEKELDNTSCPLLCDVAYKTHIRPYIETLVNKNLQMFCKLHDSDSSGVKMWVYITANNKAGDILETGRYNMRELLLPEGEGLMQIFITTIRGLIKMGIKNDDGTPADISFADDRIAELKDILAHIG